MNQFVTLRTSLSATQLKPLASDLKSLGEKTVRNAGRPSRTTREITDVLYVVTGALMRLSDAQGIQVWVRNRIHKSQN